jgi:hypothetical protein
MDKKGVEKSMLCRLVFSTPLQQFCRNFIFGVMISGFWYYVGYRFFNSFWIATILTNILTFFIGRYVVFKEGK